MPDLRREFQKNDRLATHTALGELFIPEAFGKCKGVLRKSPAPPNEACSFSGSNHLPYFARLHDPQDQSFSKNVSGASDCIDRHGSVLRIQQTIELRPAGAELPGHCLLCFLLLLHRLLKLPGKNSLHRDSFNFFPDAFLFQETVKGRAVVVMRSIRLLLFHLSPC
jgi:hypothetical protein